MFFVIFVRQRNVNMNNYRLNRNTGSNPNGNNEVHKDTCVHYSGLLSYEDLGSHWTCSSAVQKAKSLGYSKADGCKTCSPGCHTA